jgi:ABC-type Fe3+ transport system substrate-binding protein
LHNELRFLKKPVSFRSLEGARLRAKRSGGVLRSGTIGLRHGLAAALLLLGLMAPVHGAELPAASVRDLQELGLDRAILDGVESELAVPAAWIEGARREGKLRVFGTWDATDDERLIQPFRERYPFIAIAYTAATDRLARSTRPLTALRQGRVLADVISGLGANIFAFRDIGALMPLGDLPGFSTLPPDMRDADGLWVGHQLNYWCIAYNRARVAPGDLPAGWEDLLAPARWGDGKIGLGNRPNLWLLPLVGERGEGWARAYAERLLTAMKPQLRKEGMNALIQLLSLGEFDLALPVAQTRLATQTGRGAAIGWHCPAPVPAAVQTIAIIEPTPYPNAAKLYVNWLLSREGQIAQFLGTGGAPVRSALQGPALLPYAAALAGKTLAVRVPSLLEEQEWPAMQAYWDRLWQAR